MKWRVEVITHINHTYTVDADSEEAAYRAGEAAARATMDAAAVPAEDIALIDVQGADPLLPPPRDLGHRFAGDPDEAPRCVYCDARAGGSAAALPCEAVYPGYEPPAPEDYTTRSTWNAGTIEGPGD